MVPACPDDAVGAPPTVPSEPVADVGVDAEFVVLEPLKLRGVEVVALAMLALTIR